ncbi:MAG TPA: LamG domain-containing protein [Steroidobacteraceae bacterium]|jgi:cytochrome c553|nr:LamG domain-containing protein [Steroidobacteraceae bacterium]
MRITTTCGLTLLAAMLLSACSGGAPTTANPNTSQQSTQNVYTGPPPASPDVEAFEQNLWVNIQGSNRCGACHGVGGSGTPSFARSDDINQAYQAALTVVNLSQPSNSTMVAQENAGHNCWLASNSACADIVTTWITNWAGGASGSSAGTQITLTAPPEITVGATKVNPADPTLFSSTVYPVVRAWCSRCHSDSAASPQSPYFASATLATAYSYAQPLMDLNTPTNSMFYIRLAQQSHNCWGTPVSCPDSAATMLAAIQAFANQVTVTPIDPSLVVSKALSLTQGTVASGEGRYDAHDIAKWQFQEGTGLTAYDTSGVDPAMNLTLNGNISWAGGWGITLGTGGASAQATTATSSKLAQKIQASGQYSIEMWIDPANTTQTNADVVAYADSATSNNFAFAQAAVQYQGYALSTVNPSDTALTTNPDDNDDSLAQAALQHVVMTYDPTDGRKIYVDGQLSCVPATGGPCPSGVDVDKLTGGALTNWDPSSLFLLGSAPGGQRAWQGTIKFVAIHDVALNQQQVQQNYAAGVGATYYLLFDVSSLTNTPQSYVMFQASQYDNYSYLFFRPTFISLDSSWTPSAPIALQGIRLGENGQELPVDQAYIPLNVNIDAKDYSPTTGQLLSPIGTVIPLQNGPTSDQFFLTFAQIGSNSHTYTEATPTPSAPVDLAPSSDIGVRLWDELNNSMASATTVPVTASVPLTTYQNVQQQLPNVVDMQSATAANVISAAQLAVSYCQSLLASPGSYFPLTSGQFAASASSVLGTSPGPGMDLIATPLIQNLTGQGAGGLTLATQPADGTVRTEIYNLIQALETDTPGASTQTVTMGVCTALLSSATSLIK